MIPAVIIDDKAIYHNIIKNVISNNFNDEIKILADAFDVKSGIFAIKKHNPKIVFLDIEMPDGTGFDLLRKLKNPGFKLIFITAHEEYTLQAIKFSALDYLLKPLDDDEIIQAIENAVKKITTEDEYLKIKAFIDNYESNTKKIVLKTSNNIHIIKTTDIIRCESDNNYTIFYLNSGKKIMVSKTLKFYDNLLSEYNFIRVHKSHLVNSSYIVRLKKDNAGIICLSDNSEIPVSVRKHDEVLKAIEKL